MNELLRDLIINIVKHTDYVKYIPLLKKLTNIPIDKMDIDSIILYPNKHSYQYIDIAIPPIILSELDNTVLHVKHGIIKCRNLIKLLYTEFIEAYPNYRDKIIMAQIEPKYKLLVNRIKIMPMYYVVRTNYAKKNIIEYGILVDCINSMYRVVIPFAVWPL